MAWYDPSRSPLVVAHRGDHREHPENTLAAVQAAIDVGADMVEIDVHLAADGEVVVVHDATFQRLWGDPRPVASMDTAAIRALGGGEWRVPLLRDVLVLSVATGVPVVIDQKTPEAAVAAARLVEEAGLLDTTVFCGELPGLRAIRRVSPAARMFLNSDGLAPPDVRVLGVLRPEMYNVEHSTLAPVLVEALHNLGIGISVWSPNVPGDLERLLGMGVDSIMSDSVSDLRGLTDSKNWRAPGLGATMSDMVTPQRQLAGSSGTRS